MERYYVFACPEDDSPVLNSRFSLDEIEEHAQDHRGYFVYELVPVKRYVVRNPEESRLLIPVRKNKKGKK